MNCYDYKAYSLGDICTFIDYRGKTPVKTKSGIPLITAKIIKNGRIQKPDEFIDADEYESWMRRGIPKIGDIIITTEAPLGEVAILDTNERVAFAQRIILLQPNNEILDNKYLYYSLTGQTLKKRIQARSTGTTVTGIKSAELKKVLIDLPNLETQKNISSILYSIDKKVENNNRINYHLERIAQAVWSEWASECTEFTTVGNVANNILDYTRSNCDQVVLVNSSDVHRGNFSHHTLSINKNLKGHFKKRFSKGDILYSEIRPLNRHFAYVSFESERYIASTRLMVVRNKANKIYQSLLYQFLKTDEAIETFAKLTDTRSGTFPQGNFADLSSLKLPICPLEEQTEIAGLLDSILEFVAHNHAESINLESIRDTLLPRLLSGELSVSDLPDIP